jgi:hypothetical protein
MCSYPHFLPPKFLRAENSAKLASKQGLILYDRFPEFVSSLVWRDGSLIFASAYEGWRKRKRLKKCSKNQTIKWCKAVRSNEERSENRSLSVQGKRKHQCNRQKILKSASRKSRSWLSFFEMKVFQKGRIALFIFFKEVKNFIFDCLNFWLSFFFSKLSLYSSRAEPFEFYFVCFLSQLLKRINVKQRSFELPRFKEFLFFGCF